MDLESVEDSLRVFKRQYLQLVPKEQLRWPDSTVLKNPQNQQWVFSTLFDMDVVKHNPPQRYRLQVLKQIVSRIVGTFDNPDEDEISDDLTATLATLLSDPLPPEAISAQQRSYVTYSFPGLSTSANNDASTITLLESRSVIASSGTTGLRTWEASLHLGSYLASEKGIAYVHGKRVLELGAGTGLVSMLCSKKLGAKYVLATDGSEAVVEALDENLFLNDLDSSESIECRALKWGRFFDEGEDGKEKFFDVILGADITYDLTLFPLLISTFRMLVASNPDLAILIAATIRNEKTVAHFISTCELAQFSVTEVFFPPPKEETQAGPFYSVEVPICILDIRFLGSINGDPFAI